MNLFWVNSSKFKLKSPYIKTCSKLLFSSAKTFDKISENCENCWVKVSPGVEPGRYTDPMTIFLFPGTDSSINKDSKIRSCVVRVCSRDTDVHVGRIFFFKREESFFCLCDEKNNEFLRRVYIVRVCFPFFDLRKLLDLFYA